MYDQLEILLELQEVDREIDKLEIKRKRIPIEIQALDKELEKRKEKINTKKASIEDLNKERRSKDRQLAVQGEKLEKYKIQRLSVKTNKEYSALESEITDLEEASSNIEDEILEIMITIDEANDDLKLANEEFKKNETKINIQKDKLLSEEAELNGQISVWYEKRKKFTVKITAAMLNRYENWRKRRNSSMVAIIQEQSCGECHINLPPQLINEVRKRKELHNCNSCGRILYWKDEEVEIEE